MTEKQNRVMTFVMTICTIAMLIVSISTCNSSVKVKGIEEIIKIQQSNDSSILEILANQLKQTAELKIIVSGLNENIILLDSNYSQNVNLIKNTSRLVKQNGLQSKQLNSQNQVFLNQLKQAEKNYEILAQANQIASETNSNQIVFKELMTADYLKQYQKTKESWWIYYSRKQERDMVAKSNGKMEYPLHRKFESDITAVYNNLIWDIENLKSMLNNIISLLSNKDLAVLENEIIFQSTMLENLENNLELNQINNSDSLLFFNDFQKWEIRNMELISKINITTK